MSRVQPLTIPRQLRPQSQNPMIRVLAGAFMISFSAIFVKASQTAPVTSAFYRVFFGALFLLCIAGIRKELHWVTARQFLLLSICGLAFALDLYFWHNSIEFVGPGLATLLSNFQVFLLALCGVAFFSERLSPRFLVSLPLAVGGLALIVGARWSSLTPQYQAGIFYGLLTALCYTIFLLCLKKVQQEISSFFVVLFYSSATAALVLAGGVATSGQGFTLPSLEALLLLISLGLFCQTVGWALIAGGMPGIRTALVGLILLLQPTLSFFWDVLLFDRPTSATNWAGVCLTLAAIYMGLTGRQNPKSK